MKKFFYLLLASVFAFAFTSCSDDDNDPQPSLTQAIVGDYAVNMTYYVLIPGMPANPETIESNIKIQSLPGNYINVVVPGLDSKKSIPAITMTNIPVVGNANIYSFEKNDIEGKVEFNNTMNDYTAKLSGKVNADTKFINISEELNYGEMPFPFIVSYISDCVAAKVAGTYKTHMEVTAKGPGMNEGADPLVSEDIDLTFVAEDHAMVSVMLPTITYTGMGKPMVIPALPVKAAKVSSENGSYLLVADKVEGEFTEETGAVKSYTTSLNGTINADGTYSIVATVKYGGMPLTLTLSFSPKK